MTDNFEFDFSGAVGAEKAKEASAGGDFAREVEYLNLKADEASVAQGKNMALVRFVTDFKRRHPDQPLTKFDLPWITVTQHYAQTKQRPEYVKEGQTWPSKWNSVCRKHKIFAARYNGQCYLCDVVKNKPSARTWALGIEREQVFDDQGRAVGVRDKTREVTATDAKGEFIVVGEENGKKIYQKKTVPAWIVMNFGWKNFFGPLNGQGSYFGTILDADWLITRTGTDENTLYTPVRVGEIYLPEGNDYGLPAGTKYDLGIDGLMEKIYPDMPDLRKIVGEKTTDDYYGRWFVPGWSPPNQQGQQQGQQAPQGQPVQGQGYQPQAPQAPQVPQSQEPPSGALDALKSRVLGGAQQAPAFQQPGQ